MGHNSVSKGANVGSWLVHTCHLDAWPNMATNTVVKPVKTQSHEIEIA